MVHYFCISFFLFIPDLPSRKQRSRRRIALAVLLPLVLLLPCDVVIVLQICGKPLTQSALLTVIVASVAAQSLLLLPIEQELHLLEQAKTMAKASKRPLYDPR